MDNYYDVGGTPVIDILKEKLTNEEYKGFCKGNILKYVMRAGYKDNNSELKDLQKAKVYLEWLIMCAKE